MNKRKILIVTFLIIIILAIVLVIIGINVFLLKKDKVVFGICTPDVFAEYLVNNEENFENYNIEPKTIEIDEEILFKDEEDISNIINYLKTINTNFNEENFEININNEEKVEDKNIRVINFEYKIEKFYTNSGYKAVIEDEKASKVIDRMIYKDISEDDYELMKKISEEKIDILITEEYMQEAFKIANFKKANLKDVKLFYDMQNGGVYYWISIENNVNGNKELIQKKVTIYVLP